MAFTANLTADGQTGEFTASGSFRVHLAGTFGGGTVTLEQRINNTFETLVGTAQTADSDFILDSLKDGGIYRFDVAGSTTPAIVINVLGSAEANRSFV
jgi:hypothetical protein